MELVNKSGNDTAQKKDVTVIGSIEIRGPRLRKVGYDRRKEAARGARARRSQREPAS